MSRNDLQEKYGDPLCERSNGRITVTLFAAIPTNPRERIEDFFIFYSDIKTGLCFSLNPPRFLVLDAWKHPIVYFDANLLGIENPNKLMPVAA